MAFDFTFYYNIFMKKQGRRDSAIRIRRELVRRCFGREDFQIKLREHLTNEGVSPPVTKAEIWIDGYLKGKCFLGFVHPGDDKVYTHYYRAIAEAVCPCEIFVTGDILEIQKKTYPEETRGIPLLRGHAVIDDLIATVENTCGYYIKDITDVNGVRIVNVVREPLTIWIAGKEIAGYMKNGVSHICLKDLQIFAYLLGAHRDADAKTRHNYLCADIYDRKLRLEGHTLKSVPLEYYNALDIERIMDKGRVEDDNKFEYVIVSSWTAKNGARYAAIAQKADIAVWGELEPHKKPADFGQAVLEYPPSNKKDVSADVWFDGAKLSGHINDKRTDLNLDKKNKNAANYFTRSPNAEAAIESRGDSGTASRWYDNSLNAEVIIVNTKMKSAPVNLVRRGSLIVITANIIYKGKTATKKFEGTDNSYAETVTRAIKECFEGRYDASAAAPFGCDYVDVIVNITHNAKAPHITFFIGGKGRAASAYETSWSAGAAAKNRAQIFAAGMSSYYNYPNLAAQAAHLFGHMLGLCDMQAPGSLMNNTSATAAAREIYLAIEAFKTNKQQGDNPK